MVPVSTEFLHSRITPNMGSQLTGQTPTTTTSPTLRSCESVIVDRSACALSWYRFATVNGTFILLPEKNHSLCQLNVPHFYQSAKWGGVMAPLHRIDHTVPQLHRIWSLST